MSASGTYPAAIARHLTNPSVIYKIDYEKPSLREQIMVTERHNTSLVTNIRIERNEAPSATTGTLEQQSLGSGAPVVAARLRTMGHGPTR